MVIHILECRFCGSQNVIRQVRDGADRKRYLCHDCRRTFREHPGTRAHSAQFRERVLAAYHERASMRGVCRVFGIGRQTLSDWLKKPNACRRLKRPWPPPSRATYWNWTNSGPSWPAVRTSTGSGLPSAAAHARSSRM
jgi:transposase-like protein